MKIKFHASKVEIVPRIGTEKTIFSEFDGIVLKTVDIDLSNHDKLVEKQILHEFLNWKNNMIENGFNIEIVLIE